MTRLFSLLFLFLLVWPLAAQQPNKTDDRIYDQVRERLADDADVKGGAIDVSVKDGVVTLKGQVRTGKAKEKATKLTKKVKGVVSVENLLTIMES